MQNDKQHLQIFDVLRFPLVALIVFIHSYHPTLETMGGGALFTWHFIRDGLAGVAVPGFFLMSGYLFFYKLDWSRRKWLGKLKSRVFTILIPFIGWTLLYWAFMLLINHLPEWTLPQFWYLQELVLLCIMAPLFHWMHRRPHLFLVTLALVWLFRDWNLEWPVLTSMMPILFFYAGSVLAVKNVTSIKFNNKWMGTVLFASLADLLLGVGLQDGLLRKAGVLGLLLCLFWLATILKENRVKQTLLKLSPSVFFVFAFHEPAVQFLAGDLNTVYQPATDGGKLALYLVSPIIMLFASVNAFNVLNYVAPGFTKFITGGRS